jgi:CBS domain-containing protein/sporulation protein YlmC with PRC-barrel domain
VCIDRTSPGWPGEVFYMLSYTEMYLSELVGKPIIDQVGEKIGRVADIVFTLGETFPRVVGIDLDHPGSSRMTIPRSLVNVVNREFMSLSIPFKALQPIKPGRGEVHLFRDLLDKQIVDTDGCKVVRVNDLKLANLGDGTHLVAADIGFAGLFRRLGVLYWAERVCRLFGRTMAAGLIAWDQIEPLETELSSVKLRVPHQKLSALHPADIADIVQELNSAERAAIFRALDGETAAETLQEVEEPDMQAAILESVGVERAATILDNMSLDEVADLVGDLPAERGQRILNLLGKEDAEDVRELMAYEGTSAGGLMTTEFVALLEDMTCEATITRLRELAPDAEMIYYLYVVDAHEHLVGVLSLRDLIVAPPHSTLAEIMTSKVVSANADADVRELAATIRKYGFLALPVVDADSHILGIVTLDDIWWKIMSDEDDSGHLLRTYRY